MKTFTNSLRVCSWIILFSVFYMFNAGKVSAQKLVTDSDGSQHIKIELMGHSYFSRMLIVSEAKLIQGAKVVISEETGIIYIYPTQKPAESLFGEVEKMVKKAEKLDKEYNKDKQTEIINDLVSANGDWLEQYALTGERTNENDSCHKSFPFCTNTIYTFPAGVNTSAQVGPNYSCLSTRPNPAWYHLKILDPGPIAIYMFSTPSRDIDFCLWGPFMDPLTPCPMTNSNGGLTGSKVVDCSYSPNPTETANIPNGQTGQYYILIITNFSNQPCDITFQQSSGTGSTDCTILPPPATTNSPVCVGETIQLSAATVIGAQYQWSHETNGFLSNQQNPTIPNAQFSDQGVYSLTITVGGQTSDPTSTEVFVYNPPTATISGTASICKGDSTQLSIATTGVGPYRVVVSTGMGIPSVINFFQSPHTFWVKPSVTTTYTLTTVSNNACSGSVFGEAVVTVRPTPVPDFTTSNLCSGLQTQFTDATAIGMGSIATWEWNFGDGGTSNLQNPQHVYSTMGLYQVGLNVISSTGCAKSTVLPVSIQPTPSVNAGADKTIPYGTSTGIDGSASGGSGSHAYQWQPADKLIDVTILTPTTVLLEATTDFTLTATDSGNGCQKSDQMTVTITGGPLSAVVQASPPEICIGGSTLLNALPSGGSSNYTYSWTSNPPGFTSNLEDVTVSPTVNTTYTISIFDGFNTVVVPVQVVVNTLPVVNAGNDISIAHGTNTGLNAIVTGGSSTYTTYQWAPGALLENPWLPVTQTYNLYESQSFTLTVTDSKGCIGTDQMTITIVGGPLQVNPVADDPTICRNETTTIRAVPGGGSNNYVSYAWTSVPAGFISDEPNPEVSPNVTTDYYVTVNDGFNTTEGSVHIAVNQLPSINLIPYDPKVQVIDQNTIGICVYDTVTIDAGNPGAQYLWSNGATDQTIEIKTSGISFDVQEYQVNVMNLATMCENNATITAYFTFQNCSYGIEELEADQRMMIYPNPSSDGQFKVVIEDLSGELQLEVYSSIGKLLSSHTLPLQTGNRFETYADLGNYSNGVFILKLTGKDVVILKRLIISK